MVKHIFYIVVVLTSCFLSCTKSSTSPESPSDNGEFVVNDNHLHAVTFSLDGFEIDYGKRMSSKEMAAKDYLKFLFYEVFDSSGNFLKRIDQEIYKDSTTFGKISDSLRSGKYTIVVAGTNDTNYIRHSYRFESVLEWFPQDVFYKKIELLVAGQDTTINNLRLDRISGKLEIRLKPEVVPANVKYADVFIDSIAPFFDLLNGTLSGRNGTYGAALNPAVNYNPDLNMAFYCYGSDNKMRVILRAYDEKEQIVVRKVIENVQVFANKKTILKGSLFDSEPIGNTVLPITVDPDYAETIIQNY
jgi:hypothetical protein